MPTSVELVNDVLHTRVCYRGSDLTTLGTLANVLTHLAGIVMNDHTDSRRRGEVVGQEEIIVVPCFLRQ